jgi:hypothetical protein
MMMCCPDFFFMYFKLIGMSDVANEIRNHHKVGLRGIWDILLRKGTFKKFPFWLSVILSAGICLSLICLSPEKSFRYLKDSTELILSFFPSLLGFSLGGYALVVGFSNLDLIKAGAKPDKHSVYQILNAVFSLCIFLQVMTTLLSFVVSWIIKVNLFDLTTTKTGIIGDATNSIVLLLMVFSSVYSLLLTPYVVTNLFTLSQVNSSFLTIQKLSEDRNQKSLNGNSDESISTK